MPIHALESIRTCWRTLYTLTHVTDAKFEHMCLRIPWFFGPYAVFNVQLVELTLARCQLMRSEVFGRVGAHRTHIDTFVLIPRRGKKKKKNKSFQCNFVFDTVEYLYRKSFCSVIYNSNMYKNIFFCILKSHTRYQYSKCVPESKVESYSSISLLLPKGFVERIVLYEEQTGQSYA